MFLAFLKKKRIDFIDQDVVMVLDRHNISCTAAMDIICIVLVKLEAYLKTHPNDFIVSLSSIWRKRILRRQDVIENLMVTIISNIAVTLHWDGITTYGLTGKKKGTHRLPIVITRKDYDQLLGIPIVDKEDAESCSEAIFEQVKKWNLDRNIKAFLL